MMNAKCKLCGDVIDLLELTAAGYRGHERMRKHLLQKHTVFEIAAVARRCGWLIDSLVFEAVEACDAEGWRGYIDSLVTGLMEGGIVE